MQKLLQSIAIIPAKRFLLPGQEISIAIKEKSQQDQIAESHLLNKEIGIPFWIDGKFNVYGCSAQITNVHYNNDGLIDRIRLKGTQFFRIKEYRKANQEAQCPTAGIKVLSNLEDSISTPELIIEFEKFTNAISMVRPSDLSTLDLVKSMNLNQELTISIISKENRLEREKLLIKILKFKNFIKQQEKLFTLN